MGIFGKTPATAEKVAKLQFAAVKVSEAEVKNFKFQKSTASATDLKMGGKSTAEGKIEVFFPKDGDIWDANKEYQINWQSTGLTGDVKIDLESTLIVGGKRYSLPITERAPNTGTYRFRVPQNWGAQNFQNVRVRVSTLDGTVSGTSPGTIKVFTRWIDLQCMIVDAKTMVQSTYYPFYSKTQKWIEFNVWMRNKGIRSPITINEVLVRIIKEPEGVVCNQETWGYGPIYYHDWYKLPEPRKFDVESWGHSFKDFNKDVDLKKGAYRIEVEVDPQNQLGESQESRDDNKTVVKYQIR